MNASILQRLRLPAPLARDPRVQAGALAAALVVALGLAYAFSGAPADPATVPADPSAATEPEPAPTAENVDPTVHARLMTLRREVEATPADTTRLLELARMEQDAHQFAQAAATYERVLALAPAHRQARLDQALAYSTLGQWDDARRSMEALLARYPDDPAGLYNLGAILANQGDYAGARPYWERVRAQTADAELAQQAAGSLQQLDGLASGAAPSAPRPAIAGRAPAAPVTAAPVLAGRAPAPAAPASGTGGLPAGHPPLPAGATGPRPATVGGVETAVLSGAPLPAESASPAAPAPTARPRPIIAR